MLATELLRAWPQSQWEHRRLLVGVSGGADSVALLLALRELAEPSQLVAAHFNHRWRGAESDADQKFVDELCQHLALRCLFGSGSAMQLSPTPLLNQNDDRQCVESAMLAKAINSESVSSSVVVKSEEAAREARYAFFIRAAYECGASYVVTGHTADDRTETLLHNLFRGSGLAGAASLRQFRKLDQDLVLTRPLIMHTRENVLQYLAERGQTFRSDSSNDNARYARNYLRQQLLPVVRARYPQVDANLLRFSELAEEALDDIEQLGNAWRDRIMASMSESAKGQLPASWTAAEYWLMPAAAALDQPWSLLRAALRQIWLERNWPMQELDRGHWESLRATLQSAAAQAQLGPRAGAFRIPAPQILLQLPGGVRVESAGGLLAIGRVSLR